MDRGPVHHLDAGRYRAVIREGVPMIERADGVGAVLAVEDRDGAVSGEARRGDDGSAGGRLPAPTAPTSGAEVLRTVEAYLAVLASYEEDDRGMISWADVLEARAAAEEALDGLRSPNDAWARLAGEAAKP